MRPKPVSLGRVLTNIVREAHPVRKLDVVEVRIALRVGLKQIVGRRQRRSRSVIVLRHDKAEAEAVHHVRVVVIGGAIDITRSPGTIGVIAAVRILASATSIGLLCAVTFWPAERQLALLEGIPKGGKIHVYV